MYGAIHAASLLVLLTAAGWFWGGAPPQAPADLAELLAQTNAKVEQFEYSPDGSQIAYVSARNGSHDIWVMDADGSNARVLTDTYPEREENPKWSPDGKWIAYTSRGEIFKILADGSMPYINLTYGRGGSSLRWTPDGESIVFVRGGENGHSQLAMISAAVPDGAIEAKFLTHSPFSNTDPQISPDGRWVAFTSDRSGKIDRQRMDIWVMPLAGGPERLLTPGTEETYEYFPRWSPDGRKLAFVSIASGWRNIGVIDVETGERTRLTRSPWDEANPQWSPDGQWIAYAANRGWNLHLMKVSVNGGEPQVVVDRPGVSGGFEGGQVRGTLRWSPDGGSIAYTHMGPAATNDVWTVRPDGADARQLTNHMPEGLDASQFISPEMITYPSMDGLEIPAFLYRPRTVSADATPPLLLYARANTHGMHVNGFYPFIQYFLAKGYVVLAPQVRGSGGHGWAYERLNFGDWGGGDIDDIVSGIRHLAEAGLIDPDRVAMQGGSTGGYFTMQTIVRYPDVVRAAVNFYGPTNLVHMYRTYSPAQKPTLGDVVGGDHGEPDQAMDHWMERSAIFSIDQVKTPLLILWGDRDYGVRISMAEEYYLAARERGQTVDYVLYHSEPHGWYAWRPETLESALRRVEAHYQEYIGQ